MLTTIALCVAAYCVVSWLVVGYVVARDPRPYGFGTLLIPFAPVFMLFVIWTGASMLLKGLVSKVFDA